GWRLRAAECRAGDTPCDGFVVSHRTREQLGRGGATMKLASFNVESFFDRPKALNATTWAEGRPYLEAFTQLNELLEHDPYSEADKKQIADLLVDLKLDASGANRYVVLRENRGHLLQRHRGAPPTITASGRSAWIGWVELATETVDEIATTNTGQVIIDVDA